MNITMLEFFNDYLHYVQTGAQSPNLNSLTARVRKKDGSRKWVHSFTDLESDALENVLYNLLQTPVVVIQKNPALHFKLLKITNPNIEKVITNIKEELKSKELREQQIHANTAMAAPTPPPIIATTPILPPRPILLLPPATLYPTIQKTLRTERRSKMIANFAAQRKTFGLKKALLLIGGLVLILVLALLLRRYFNSPGKLPFFPSPANTKIMPTLDGVKVSIDCGTIATKFADCRNATLDHVQRCLELLKVDDTAVFTNTSGVHERLAALAPDCEMQLLTRGGAAYSAVAKVMRDGHEALVAPSVGTMACLLNVLQHAMST